MSRWIDSDALEGKAKEYGGYYEDTVYAVPLADISEAPTIDLVRCAECKFKRLYDEGETKYYFCALEDRPNRQWSVDDWNFCCWGERRESE